MFGWLLFGVNGLVGTTLFSKIMSDMLEMLFGVVKSWFGGGRLKGKLLNPIAIFII